MKKNISFFFVILILSLSLLACSNNTTVSTVTCKELLDAAINIEGDDGIEIYSSDSTEIGKYLDEFMISDFYGSLTVTPDLSIVDSYAVFTTDDQIVKECHIFKTKSVNDINTIKSYLENRFDRVKKKFIGYLPEQVAYAEEGQVFVYKNFVIYVATISNNDAIIEAIKNRIDEK